MGHCPLVKPGRALTITLEALSDQAKKHLPAVVAEGGCSVRMDVEGMRADPEVLKSGRGWGERKSERLGGSGCLEPNTSFEPSVHVTQVGSNVNWFPSWRLAVVLNQGRLQHCYRCHPGRDLKMHEKSCSAEAEHLFCMRKFPDSISIPCISSQRYSKGRWCERETPGRNLRNPRELKMEYKILGNMEKWSDSVGRGMHIALAQEHSFTFFPVIQ